MVLMKNGEKYKTNGVVHQFLRESCTIFRSNIIPCLFSKLRGKPEYHVISHI